MAEDKRPAGNEAEEGKTDQPYADTGITAVHGDGGQPRTPGKGDPAVTRDPAEGTDDGQ